jgi:uncharacterized protein YndB with AHSA1/START domain
MENQGQRLLFVVILLVYLLAGALYMLVTPAWQNPDEPAHYNYISALAGHGVIVSAGPEKCFEYLIEPSNRSNWVSGFGTAELLPENEENKSNGLKVWQLVTKMNGQDFFAREVLTEAVPNSLIKTEQDMGKSGALLVSTAISIEETGTKIKADYIYRPGNFILRVFTPLFKKRMEKNNLKHYEKLRSVLTVSAD